MESKEVFLGVLRRAVPPTSEENRALGGLLLQLYRGVVEAHAGVVEVRKLAAAGLQAVDAKIGGAPQADASVTEEEAPPMDDTIPPVSPIPPDVAAQMKAAGIDPLTGEPVPGGAPPAPPKRAPAAPQKKPVQAAAPPAPSPPVPPSSVPPLPNGVE